MSFALENIVFNYLFFSADSPIREQQKKYGRKNKNSSVQGLCSWTDRQFHPPREDDFQLTLSVPLIWSSVMIAEPRPSLKVTWRRETNRYTKHLTQWLQTKFTFHDELRIFGPGERSNRKIRRSFVVCTLHLILLGWLTWAGWDGRDIQYVRGDEKHILVGKLETTKT
jgi:hypothetical protein